MKRGETPFKEVTEVMSVESFENKVANGEELVLLDDNVLDIKDYKFIHPGGKFVL